MADANFLRDIKRNVIQAIFKEPTLMQRLVLKGGNLLDVVYELSIRASVDVDLSLDGEVDDDDLRRWMEDAITSHFATLGYVVFDFNLRHVPPNISDDLKDFWGGYNADFKLIESDKHTSFNGKIEDMRRNACNVGKKNSTKFMVDISCYEFCGDKEKYDVDGVIIYGYSTHMFVAEKVRAICQQMPEYVKLVHLHPRARASDFVDIEIVTRQYAIDFGSPSFQETVRKVFDHKKVPLHWSSPLKLSHSE
jgi:hypothetical protein